MRVFARDEKNSLLFSLLSTKLVNFLDRFRGAIVCLESLQHLLIRRTAVSKGDHRNEDLSTFAAMKACGSISAPMNM
jgi:hypothetical protein